MTAGPHGFDGFWLSHQIIWCLSCKWFFCVLGSSQQDLRLNNKIAPLQKCTLDCLRAVRFDLIWLLSEFHISGLNWHSCFVFWCKTVSSLISECFCSTDECWSRLRLWKRVVVCALAWGASIERHQWCQSVLLSHLSAVLLFWNNLLFQAQRQTDPCLHNSACPPYRCWFPHNLHVQPAETDISQISQGSYLMLHVKIKRGLWLQKWLRSPKPALCLFDTPIVLPLLFAPHHLISFFFFILSFFFRRNLVVQLQRLCNT